MFERCELCTLYSRVGRFSVLKFNMLHVNRLCYVGQGSSIIFVFKFVVVYFFVSDRRLPK